MADDDLLEDNGPVKDNIISADRLVEGRLRARARGQMQMQTRGDDRDRRRTDIQHHCPHVVEAPLAKFNPDELAALIETFEALRRASNDPSFFEVDQRVIRFFFRNEADAVQILKLLR